MSDWDRIAAAIGQSLGNRDFDYFRSDKLACYADFYLGNSAPPPKILDVGCGPGHFVFFAARRGAAVTGLDASRGMLELCRRRLAEAGLEAGLLQADLDHRLPFQDNAFDMAVCESVLNHIGRPAALLKEINRVLRPAGTLVLDVSNAWGLPWRLAIRLAQAAGSYPKGRIHWMAPRSVHALARRASFLIQGIRGLHCLPPPRFTSIGFRSRRLLPPALEAGLEKLFYRTNLLLERSRPARSLCFKYLVKCRKPD